MNYWALFQATGDITAESIHLMPTNDNVINRFIVDVDKLRKDIGTLAKETYEISKKSAHQMENWMFESKQEDALVNEFMRNWLDRRNLNRETEADPDMEARIQHMVQYVMKPQVVHGSVSVAKVSGKQIPFPVYKTNKRIVGAMARWLKSNEQQAIFDHIFTNYGKHYRRMKDNLITEEMSELHTSSLYHRGGPTADRSPIIDLVFDKNLLYQPNLVASMLHITRRDLKRFADRSRIERDAEGDLVLVSQYGNSKDVRNSIKTYKDPKEFKKEDKDVECG